jgi:hypothetical protein
MFGISSRNNWSHWFYAKYWNIFRNSKSSYQAKISTFTKDLVDFSLSDISENFEGRGLAMAGLKTSIKEWNALFQIQYIIPNSESSKLNLAKIGRSSIEIKCHLSIVYDINSLFAQGMRLIYNAVILKLCAVAQYCAARKLKMCQKISTQQRFFFFQFFALWDFQRFNQAYIIYRGYKSDYP